MLTSNVFATEGPIGLKFSFPIPAEQGLCNLKYPTHPNHNPYPNLTPNPNPNPNPNLTLTLTNPNPYSYPNPNPKSNPNPKVGRVRGLF